MRILGEGEGPKIFPSGRLNQSDVSVKKKEGQREGTKKLFSICFMGIGSIYCIINKKIYFKNSGWRRARVKYKNNRDVTTLL
jgi:hypothetical protein